MAKKYKLVATKPTDKKKKAPETTLKKLMGDMKKLTKQIERTDTALKMVHANVSVILSKIKAVKHD